MLVFRSQEHIQLERKLEWLLFEVDVVLVGNVQVLHLAGHGPGVEAHKVQVLSFSWLFINPPPLEGMEGVVVAHVKSLQQGFRRLKVKRFMIGNDRLQKLLRVGY